MSGLVFQDKASHTLVDQLAECQHRGGHNLGVKLRGSELPSLLDEVTGSARAPVLRTVHHFACTGGTLISKCISSMPCTLLLSEVDPLSSRTVSGRFAPTDLIELARLGSKPPSQETVLRVFLAGLSALEADVRSMGQDLVLRDHSHGHFCDSSDIPDRPTLREILMPNYQLLSLVTVRHPLDSFLSLRRLEWLHFLPATIEEYARRYHLFLDRYEGIQIFRYEDFVGNPKGLMPQFCEVLKLPYNPDFVNLFSAQKLSGDSGRSSTVIERRQRRAIPDTVQDMLVAAPIYTSLCARLGYIADLQPVIRTGN